MSESKYERHIATTSRISFFRRIMRAQNITDILRLDSNLAAFTCNLDTHFRYDTLLQNTVNT